MGLQNSTHLWSLLLVALFWFHPGLACSAEKYALLIGVSKYEHAGMNQPEPLKFPEEDAKSLGQLLKSGGYEVDVVLGKNATQAEVQTKFGDLTKKADADGIVLIGLFGHGVEIETYDEQQDVVMEGCFCPFDTNLRLARDAKGNQIFTKDKRAVTEPDPATLIKLSELMVTLNKAKAGHRVVMADCCRTVANQARGRSFGAGFRAQDLPAKTTILFGCSPSERAWEHQNWKHGAFTKCLLEGMNELSGKGSIETGDLAVFLKKRVPELVATVAPRYRQTPIMFSTDSVDLQFGKTTGNANSPGSRSSRTSSSRSKKVEALQLTGETMPIPAEGWIDLLSMVKLPEHSIVGNWKRVGKSVTCERASNARIMVPIVIQGSYELQFEFTRTEGNDCFAPIFPVGSHQCLLYIGGWAGGAHGLDIVKGVRIDQRDSPAVTRPGTLKTGQRYRCHIEVTQADHQTTVKAELDKQQIVNWSGNDSELSTWHEHALPSPLCPGVMVYNSSAFIHSMQLRIPQETAAYYLGDVWSDPLHLISQTPPAEVANKCVLWKGCQYFLSDEPMSFAKAQQFALLHKGRMLTISSNEEEAFLQKLANGKTVWISAWGNPQQETWRDDRNQPLRYFGKLASSSGSRKSEESFVAVATGENRNEWYAAAPGFNDEPGVATAIANFQKSGKYQLPGVYACVKWGEETTNASEPTK